MDIKDIKDGKLISLSKAFDSRAKTLYTIYALFFFICAIYFIRLLLLSNNAPVPALIIGSLGAVVFYIVAYRFINKALMSEKLFVNKQVVHLIKQSMFGSLVKIYNVSDISNFRLLEKPKLTDHPLAGRTFDYMGFQTEQKVISEMHGDNRLAFDWKGITVVFGQDVYSWDFEALQNILLEITGSDFKQYLAT